MGMYKSENVINTDRELLRKLFNAVLDYAECDEKGEENAFNHLKSVMDLVNESLNGNN